MALRYPVKEAMPEGSPDRTDELMSQLELE